MFFNLSPASREQLSALVLKMHLSETDVVAFSLQVLFDEKYPRHGAGDLSETATEPRPRRILMGDFE